MKSTKNRRGDIHSGSSYVGQKKGNVENYKSARTPHYSSKARSEIINAHRKRIIEGQDNVWKKHYPELESEEEAENEPEFEIEINTKEHLPVTSAISQFKLSLFFWILTILLAFSAVSESIGSLFMNMDLTAIWWTIGFVIHTAAVISMTFAVFERGIGRKVPLKARAVYKVTEAQMCFDKTSAENYKSTRTPHCSSKARSKAKNSHTKRIIEGQKNVCKKHYSELDSDEETEFETEIKIETKEHRPVISTRSQIKLSLLFWMLIILHELGAVSEVCNSSGPLMSMGFTALDKITSKSVPKTFENCSFAKQELKMIDDPSTLQEHHEQFRDSAKEKYHTKAEETFNELDTVPQACSTYCPDQIQIR